MILTGTKINDSLVAVDKVAMQEILVAGHLCLQAGKAFFSSVYAIIRKPRRPTFEKKRKYFYLVITRKLTRNNKITNSL